VSRLTIVTLIPMAFYFWAGWLLWAILLRISGMRHPMVDEWPGVTPGRRWLAALALLMMLVTLTPAPFAHSSLRQVVRVIRGQESRGGARTPNVSTRRQRVANI